MVKMMGTRIKHLLFPLFPQPRDLSGASHGAEDEGKEWGWSPVRGVLVTMVVEKVVLGIGLMKAG